MVSRQKQRGAAVVELIAACTLIISLVWIMVDVIRFLNVQDKLNLAVSSVSQLAADLPPQNEQNRKFVNLLCGPESAKSRFDDCPHSTVIDGLLEIARRTVGLASTNQMRMQIVYINGKDSIEFELAKTSQLGGASCSLTPDVPGPVHISRYLTDKYSSSGANVKNRADNQFVYVAICLDSINLSSRLAQKFDNPLFADAISLRRYWYQGDRIEN